MTLDERETRLVHMALWHLRTDADNQCEGKRVVQVTGAAWRCAKRVIAECDELIAKIEREIANG